MATRIATIEEIRKATAACEYLLESGDIEATLEREDLLIVCAAAKAYVEHAVEAERRPG